MEVDPFFLWRSSGDLFSFSRPSSFSLFVGKGSVSPPPLLPLIKASAFSRSVLSPSKKEVFFPFSFSFFSFRPPLPRIQSSFFPLLWQGRCTLFFCRPALLLERDGIDNPPFFVGKKSVLLTLFPSSLIRTFLYPFFPQPPPFDPLLFFFQVIMDGGPFFPPGPASSVEAYTKSFFPQTGHLPRFFFSPIFFFSFP